MFKIKIHNLITRITKLCFMRTFVNRLVTSFTQSSHKNTITRNLHVLKPSNLFGRLSFFPNVNNSINFNLSKNGNL